MRFFVFVFCLFLTAVFASTAKGHGIQKRIAGGNDARPGQFPFQVAMVIRKAKADGTKFTSFCGGSLISDEWVLSAAHCLYNAVRAEIYLGSTDLSTDESGRVVLSVPKENLFVYEKYTPNAMRNDIALAKLPERVALSQYIEIVNLPKRSQLSETFIKQIGWISGWGKVSDKEGTTTQLQYSRRWILPHEYCDHDFGSAFVPETQVCVDGSHGMGACQGDSGGPLTVEEDDGTRTLVGASSYGKIWCGRGNPSVYTRVSAFMDWILEKTAIPIRD